MEQILDPQFYVAQWDALRGWLAELPFPQRDLHLKTPPEICVVARTVRDKPRKPRGGEGPRLEMAAP